MSKRLADQRRFPNAHCWTVRCAVVVGLMLLGAAGCSGRATAGAFAGSTPTTAHAPIDAAPKAGAPAWCRTLDNPAVTALAGVLPQLLTGNASAALPKVQAAATVIRNAAGFAPRNLGNCWPARQPRSTPPQSTRSARIAAGREHGVHLVEQGSAERMRFPVTGLVGRWRWLAVATAAATLVAL